MAEPSPKQIAEAVADLLKAQTWEERKRIVEAQHEKLLTDTADLVLVYQLKKYRGDANVTYILQVHRDLLVCCRREGIEAAFASHLQAEGLQTLLNEIEQLRRPSDMSRRVTLCRTALRLVHRDKQPQRWAGLQIELANSLLQNPQGERAENLEQAILHIEQALQIYTRQAFPEAWARTQHNLGSVYAERIRGERAENLEQAIKHFEQALQVHTRQAFPEAWALTQNNLGNACCFRIRDERAENLEQAIKHFEQALQVFTREAFPEDWAKTQIGLGAAYDFRIRGERADNLEQAIKHFEQALQVFTREAFPEYWALTQNNLGNVYRFRIRDERAENLEQAIKHFEQALQVHTRQAFPGDWALAQYNLGAAYTERIRDERAENLEQAIKHFEQALQVYTRQAFPEAWAKTQIGLGAAYTERIRGERAENLEQAIKHFEQALQVHTRQAFPEAWALTQNSLGNAYIERLRGERAENLEQAIKHFEQALQVYTRQAFPEAWARTQIGLGAAYTECIRGERAENLEQAIKHFEQALQVYTRQAFPEDWALTQNNLGDAYRFRIRDERAENLRQAIKHFEQALQVYTRQAFPEAWALTQNNLGDAYIERIRGERAENLEQAIKHFEQALQVHTRQAFPEAWARTQNSLGNAYIERLRGERAENLEQAIKHFEQALQVYTRQAFPEYWATTQHNLANAYFRIRGERSENLEQAVLHYEQALQVFTPMTFPQNCQNTAYSLGYLLYDERRYSEARHALGTAHQAVEFLRGEVQRDIAKRSLSEENVDLYARLISSCLKEGDETAAFEYAMAGKGRAFVDLLATARFDLSAASSNDPALAEDLRIARELRQQVDNLLAILTGESDKSTMSLSDAPSVETPSRVPLPLDMLRVQLRTLQAQETSHWDQMAYKYPALTATQKAPILSVDQARRLAAELNATLVEYYCHAEGWCAFVVTPNTMHHVPLPLLDNNLLERMVKWMLRLEDPVGRNPLSYTRLSEWHDAVIAPLRMYLPREQPVVLAPFGVLHLLPLAAARHPQTRRYLAEDYLLSFVPSLSALHTMRDQVRYSGLSGQAIPNCLLNVAYPGAAPDSDYYLPDVLPEAQAIASHFTQVTPLYLEKATPEAVLEHSHDQDVVHFGCHGWFDAEQPEQSGLMLSGGWLTVQRIITELHLEQTSLTTLGACLSGREVLQRGDEHVGLLQAILTTGARAVVASLWPVDDTATRAFFETFYAKLVAGRSPANALQEAGRSLREQPDWEHPYYWAAFQVSGLAYGLQEPKQVLLSTS